MKELLLNNYQWLFSGLGVFLLSFIGMIFFRKKENIKNEQSIKVSSSHNNHINVIQNQNIQSSFNEKEKEKEKEKEYSIDAKEAMKQIENAPPFQKKEIEKNYLGQNVCWQVSYYSVSSISKNKVDVMSNYKAGYPWIYFQANIKDYPFFKIAKKDENFTIKGEITKVRDGGFEVKISQIINENGVNT